MNFHKISFMMFCIFPPPSYYVQQQNGNLFLFSQSALAECESTELVCPDLLVIMFSTVIEFLDGCDMD